MAEKLANQDDISCSGLLQSVKRVAVIMSYIRPLSPPHFF